MKKIKLNKAREWAATVTDGLGKPIDKDIFDLVVTLHALGLNTSGSCEGHMKWATGGPYVDTESMEGGRLRNIIFDFRQKHKFKKDLTQKLETMAAQARKENLKQAAKVLALLELFYKQRKVPYEVRITMSFWSYNVVRLECQGSQINVNRSRVTKLKALHAYKKEFKDFTRFLLSQ